MTLDLSPGSTGAILIFALLLGIMAWRRRNAGTQQSFNLGSLAGVTGNPDAKKWGLVALLAIALPVVLYALVASFQDGAPSPLSASRVWITIEKAAPLITFVAVTVWAFSSAFGPWKQPIRDGILLFTIVLWGIISVLTLLEIGEKQIAEWSQPPRQVATSVVRTTCTVFREARQVCKYGPQGMWVRVTTHPQNYYPRWTRAPKQYQDLNGRIKSWNPELKDYATAIFFQAPPELEDEVTLWLSPFTTGDE